MEAQIIKPLDCPLLQECINAGSVLDLFPLLKDWPQEKLLELREQVSQFYDKANEGADEAWQQLVMLPQNFFNKGNQKICDKARDDAKREVLILCSEIESVIQFYLPDKDDAIPETSKP